MLKSMSSSELTEWIAFYQIEPFGVQVDDNRSAIVAATIANQHRGKNKRPIPADRFVPKYGKRRRGKKQTVAQMRAVFQALTGSSPSDV